MFIADMSTSKQPHSFTDEEKHSFLLGIAQGFNPSKSLYHARLTTPLYILYEQHYYYGGRAVGLILLVLFLTAIYKFLLL